MGKTEVKNLLVIFILRYFSIIVFLLIVVIFLLGWLIFIRPQYDQMRKIGSLDYQGKVADLQDKQNELASLKSLAEEYNSLNFAEIKKLSQVLPPISDLPNIYGQIEALVNNLGLDLLSLSITPQISQPESGSTAAKIGVANVVVNFSSLETYSALKNFLEEVEKNIRLLDLSSLNYVPATKVYSLNFKTYYLIQ